MKFKTIWTLPAMTIRERLSRTLEWFWLFVASHLPERLAYWSYICQGVKYMEDNEEVPDVRYTDLLRRMDPVSEDTECDCDSFCWKCHPQPSDME